MNTHRSTKLTAILLVFALVLAAVPAGTSLAGSPDKVVADSSVAYAAAPIAAKAAAPKVTAVSLDARKLLFGNLGDTLTLNATVEPADAKVSDLKFTSSDKTIATVSKTGKVKAKGWGKCTVTVTVGGKSKSCRVQVAKKWLAMTFDDGPSDYTSKLLKAMKKRGINSTFFIVGAQAKSDTRQAILKRSAKQGNEIANHTYTHNGTAGALMSQLKKTDRIIKSAIGKKSKLMRPPGGAVNNVTKACGKPIILWSVDPRDWESRNTAKVYKHIMKNTKSGSIVLLHDSHSTSVAAAIKLFDSLEKKGYAFVTVTQLLNNPKANKLYYSGSKKVHTQKIA
jgi:peptidoglycan/xylan/chitin deacetylase (PgdA/CDA1 family)